MLRRLGHPDQLRISGPDLMWQICEQAPASGVSCFLYGATDATLAKLTSALGQAFPELQIAGAYAPPFRALSEAEDLDVIDRINASGAGIVWVGLGCPKQELWMAAHRGRIQAVMLGVGAAFDFHSGVVKRAPPWMRRVGLEWLHRLCSNPGRLWKRYLVSNTLFVFAAIKQLLSRSNDQETRA
jgi:N-acetylglucosaminyldiphosphoundecaprenol N-acetyl-beta-D-mannosaminyltransferase